MFLDLHSQTPRHDTVHNSTVTHWSILLNDPCSVEENTTLHLAAAKDLKQQRGSITARFHRHACTYILYNRSSVELRSFVTLNTTSHKITLAIHGLET